MGFTASYHHFDALGSTVVLTDSVELETDSYIYRANGEIVTSSGSTTNPYTWCGQVGYLHDPDLSEFTLRQREYSPEAAARFLSADPLYPETSVDPYCYAAVSVRRSQVRGAFGLRLR